MSESSPHSGESHRVPSVTLMSTVAPQTSAPENAPRTLPRISPQSGTAVCFRKTTASTESRRGNFEASDFALSTAAATSSRPLSQ